MPGREKRSWHDTIPGPRAKSSSSVSTQRDRSKDRKPASSAQHVTKRSGKNSHLRHPQPPLKIADATEAMKTLSTKAKWIPLAVASGACAAFNGVFAKLTTTELTTKWATGIAHFLRFDGDNRIVEVVVRVMFFALNLVFNGIMWAFFTKALTRGTSTAQVAILNTSSNFLITAVLGCVIFSERLPLLWFAGAALLVVGNVILGRRDERTTVSQCSDNPSRENLSTTTTCELDDVGSSSDGSDCRDNLIRI